MAPKTTNTPTAVQLAEQNVKAVEDSIAVLAAEIEPLRKERELIEQKGLLTPAEVDRLADLQEGTLPRRERYLADLQERTLPEAVATLRREELLALAADGVDGIGARRAAMDQTVTESEAIIAAELEKIRGAVDQWNAFVRPVLAVAQEAGQDSRWPADPEHPVRVEVGTMYPSDGKPLRLIVDGQDYGPVSADRAAHKAAASADKHLATLLHLGAEEQSNSEVLRGRWR